MMPARSKRKLPSETEVGGTRVVDRQLEPDDLAAVDGLHAPVGGQRVEEGEPTSGGGVWAVFLDRGKAGASVGHVDSDAVGQDVQGDAHRRRRVQQGVRHQLRRQQRRALCDLGRECPAGGPRPSGGRRACSRRPDRGAASTCHPVTYPLGAPLCLSSSVTPVKLMREHHESSVLARPPRGRTRRRRPVGRATRSAQSLLPHRPTGPCRRVRSSPRRSISPSLYMISESPGWRTSSSRGRGAPFSPDAMSRDCCSGQNMACPSDRTINGGGCPALQSTTLPVDGLIVPTMAVTTRSSIRLSKRWSREVRISFGVCPATA